MKGVIVPSILNLIKDRTVIFDGAIGSLLMDMGLGSYDCPDMWSIDNPGKVKKIHKMYLDAGADVIQTNTFGSNRQKLGSFGFQDKVTEINTAAAEIAKSITGPGEFVAGDIGPTGKFPEIGEDFDFPFYEDIFSEQGEALAKGGVDLFLIETMFDVNEAKAAVNALKKLNTSIPVFAGITFSYSPKGFNTIMGNPLIGALEELLEAGADGVGSNCTLGHVEMLKMADEIVGKFSVPTFIQPNAGQPVIEDGNVVYKTSPEEFAQYIKKIAGAGVNCVGGCCGTTPEFIKEIANSLHK